jgi:hypothetical protein
VDFITENSPDYHGGITSGQQALRLTTPDAWTTGDQFFRLNGGEDMLRDMATLPYLLFDVTTYGGADTPDQGPVWQAATNPIRTSLKYSLTT